MGERVAVERPGHVDEEPGADRCLQAGDDVLARQVADLDQQLGLELGADHRGQFENLGGAGAKLGDAVSNCLLNQTGHATRVERRPVRGEGGLGPGVRVSHVVDQSLDQASTDVLIGIDADQIAPRRQLRPPPRPRLWLREKPRCRAMPKRSRSFWTR